jgi:hypothetical protein
MSKELVMPFVDESIEFVCGFECGQIWEKLKNGNSFVGYTIHTENSAQVQMICDYYKVPCKIEVFKSDPTYSLLWTTAKDIHDSIT